MTISTKTIDVKNTEPNVRPLLMTHTVLTGVVATMGAVLAPVAHGALDINIVNTFNKNLTEDKAVDEAKISFVQNEQIIRLTEAVKAIGKDNETVKDLLKDTPTLFKEPYNIEIFTSPSNQVGAKISDGATVRLGAGSSIPVTKLADGNYSLNVENVSELKIGTTTAQFAGNTTSGVIAVGNDTEYRTITSVAAGRVKKDSTDAVNGSQLYGAVTAINKNSEMIGNNTDLLHKGMNFNGTTGTANVKMGETLTLDGSDSNIITKADGKRLSLALNNNITVKDSATVGGIVVGKDGKIINVANGTVVEGSKDVVNGSQLFATNQAVDKATQALNQGVTVNGNTGKASFKLAGEINHKGTDGNILTVADGNSVGYKLNTVIMVGTGDKAVKIGELPNGAGMDLGDKRIVGLKAGVDGKDAVNKDQLDNEINNLKKVIGGLSPSNGTGAPNAVLYDDDNHTTVTLGTGLNNPIDPNTGKPQNPVKLTNLADGEIAENSSDAVTGRQLVPMNKKLGDLEKGVADNKAKIDTGILFEGDTGRESVALGDVLGVKGDGNITTAMANGTMTISLGNEVHLNNGMIDGLREAEISPNSTQAVSGKMLSKTNQNVAENAKKIGENAKQIGEHGKKIKDLDDKIKQGITFKDGEGNASQVGLGGSLTLKNTDKNLNVVVADGEVVVNLSDNLNVGGVTINQNGIDMGNKRISGLKDGEKAQDAVTVGQMNRTIKGFDDKINQVDSNARAGVASAIAMGQLGSPWEYSQNTLSVGVGHYDGKSALAIGGGHTTDNGRWAVRYAASINQNKKLGAGLSVTMVYGN